MALEATRLAMVPGVRFGGVFSVAVPIVGATGVWIDKASVDVCLGSP